MNADTVKLTVSASISLAILLIKTPDSFEVRKDNIIYFYFSHKPKKEVPVEWCQSLLESTQAILNDSTVKIISLEERSYSFTGSYMFEYDPEICEYLFLKDELIQSNEVMQVYYPYRYKATLIR